MQYLEALGYYCIRSAGSHGLFDVIALPARGGPVLAIQVKSNSWPRPLEREQIAELETGPVVQKELWRWDDYAKEPRVRRV